MRDRSLHERPQTSWMALLFLTIAAGIASWYVVYTQRGIDIEYDEAAALSAHTLSKEQKRIELGDGQSVFVPTLSLFRPNHSWMYVSKQAALASSYQPDTLTPLTVPTAASDAPMQLRADVSHQLTALFEAAHRGTHELMVSSAYRSIADQKALYNEFVATKGESMAHQYVLAPGTSEHHTGYAVDVTDASTGCTQSSDKCNLSFESAAWLAEHAPDFGFIIRYPSGKEPVTGIAHEPWHLRYVGVALAKGLTAADVTFDEFVQQATPGRVR